MPVISNHVPKVLSRKVIEEESHVVCDYATSGTSRGGLRGQDVD
jgi:hypothetical protein